MANFPFVLAQAAAEVAKAAAAAVPAGTGQAWWESALIQFPVAALVVFVVFYFMRAMKQKDDAHQSQIRDITDADRQDRSAQQRIMTDTFKGMQVTQTEGQTRSMEIFKTAQLEATKQQSTIQVQVVDALDRSAKAIERNTEAFGRFDATLELRAVPSDKKRPKKK